MEVFFHQNSGRLEYTIKKSSDESIITIKPMSAMGQGRHEAERRDKSVKSLFSCL